MSLAFNWLQRELCLQICAERHSSSSAICCLKDANVTVAN